ncbi:MAG: hypothetical protein SGJ04_10155 [Bacteroidota bacterium]|nr:hypothetical protein [Bacteroidota bacterium]
MKKSKLIALFQVMNSHEMKWFDRYVNSTYFNQNENVIKLLGILRKYHPEFQDSKIAMENVGNLLFNHYDWREQDLRYVMTDLFKLLESFLALQEFNKDEVYKKHLLLQTYDNRGLDKHFKQSLEEAKQFQVKNNKRNVEYFFNQHLIGSDSYLHSLNQTPRAINKNLQDAVDNLDFYYLSNRLRYSAAILNREDIFQETYNNLFLVEILNLLSKIDLENIPAIGIYKRIVMLFIDADNKEHYKILIEALEPFSDEFPEDELRDMYMHALNYCNRRLSAGELSYQNEMLELYKTLLKKNILTLNGQLSPGTVKNIVTLALRLDQAEFAKEFLENYKGKIIPEFRDNTYIYNTANLHFHNRDFSKALRLLQTVDIEDIYYHLDAKILLLKTYFELNDIDPFNSLVEAFSNYLKRNKKISETQRKIYLNFIKYVKKLMQARTKNKIDKDEFIESMKETANVANMHWLTIKVGEEYDKIKKERI